MNAASITGEGSVVQDGENHEKMQKNTDQKSGHLIRHRDVLGVYS